MRFIRSMPLLCALLLAACGTTQQGGYTRAGAVVAVTGVRRTR
jgi:hypothetical protein